MTDIRNLRILYIDDMNTVRNILKKSFKDMECTFAEGAHDGVAALNKMEAAANTGTPYDVIVCDWHMPNLNGIDLIKILRKHKNPSIRDVRFIMITGADNKIREAMDSGVDNYIAKPFTAEELIAKIQFVVRNDPDRKAA